MMYPFRWGWDWDWGWGLASVIGSIVLLVILVIPWFFFLLNLQNLLLRVQPRNRAMPSGYVWLNFIPVFNLGWFLYTVMKVRDSVRAEYVSRGWAPEGDQGYNVGLVTGVLAIASFFLGWVPGIGWAIAIAQLICWILYWLKTHELVKRLSTTGTYTYGARDTYSGHRPGGPGAPGGPGGGYSAGPPPYQQQPASPPSRPAPSQTSPQPAPRPAPEQEPPAAPQGAAPQPTAGEPQPGEPQPGERRWNAPPVWPTSPAQKAQPEAGGVSGGRAGDDQAVRGRELVCAACGTQYSPGDRFCRTCGLRLPE